MIANLIPNSMTNDAFKASIAIEPKELIASNSKLKQDGIWQFSLPAYQGAYINNGNIQRQITCPSAGTCKAFCYASQGCFSFSNVMVKHSQNLNYLINKPFDFVEKMVKEIRSKVVHTDNFRAFRWNDSGDIFSEGYWAVMKAVMNAMPDVQFYAYSKRVSFLKKKQANGEFPKNFTVIFSFGGTEDRLIDINTDRHAKVFHSRQALRDAGYSDGTNTDRLATNPKFQKIGIVVHGNYLAMPKFRKMVEKINSKEKQG